MYPNAIAAVVVCVIFPVLAGIAVALRIRAQRNVKQNGISADDYFILASEIVSLGLCIMGIYGACEGGYGWPLKDVVIYNVGERFEKIVFAGQILWAAAVTLVRVGLLLWYRRFFWTFSWFRTTNSIVIGITGCFFLTAFFATLFSYSWKTTVQNKINFPVWLIASGALNMVLDIATLALPLLVIKSLQMSLKRKVMVSGIFALGIFCIIASIVRLHYFVRLHHIPETDRQFSTITFYCFTWSVIEPCTSIIAVCLPTFGPLIKDVRSIKSFLESALSIFSLRSSNTRSKTTLEYHNDRQMPSISGWRDIPSNPVERIYTKDNYWDHQELQNMPG